MDSKERELVYFTFLLYALQVGWYHVRSGANLYTLLPAGLMLDVLMNVMAW
jgi:hypothetical protein